MVKRKNETREEYLARERERNSHRDRALYLREYACKKLHGCSLAEWLAIKEANKRATERRKDAERAKKVAEKEAEETARKRKKTVRRAVRKAERMAADPAYACYERKRKREWALDYRARAKRDGAESYYKKLLYSRCYNAFRYIQNPPPGRYSGPRGQERFFRDLERAFMLGVFRFVSACEREDVLLKRASIGISDAEYLRTRGCFPMSTAERIIFTELLSLGISVFREHTFPWLINSATGAPYRCDFYLPEHNAVIEYNGPQHYLLTHGKSTVDLASRQVMDTEKVELLTSHGVRVFVVPYTEDSLRKIRVFLTAAGLDLWTS